MTAATQTRSASNSRSGIEPYDVAVVGGGLVGAAAALTLGRSGFRVALIDRRRPTRTAGALGFDIRSVALSRSSLDLMGIEIAANRIDQMCIWEEYGGGRLTFSASEAGVDALAWIVESSRACVALWDECGGLPNVDWIEGVVDRIVSQDAGITLKLDNRSVAARLLIAADGADSKVRALAGVGLADRSLQPGKLPRPLTRMEVPAFPPSPEAYFHASAGDAAIATVVRTARPHHDIAYQKFSADGPLAFLPLADPTCSAVIWSTQRGTADELAALDDAAFTAALDAASEHALGGIARLDRRFTFPLPQRVVRDFNPAPRILLVGDAAHTLHPLAGQGVNLGLEDVAGIVEEAVRDPTDLGRAGRWRSFALRRRARAEVMIGLMRAFRDGYAYGGPIGRWIRNSGVRTIDATPAIKRQLVREAMGMGVLAKLA